MTLDPAAHPVTGAGRPVESSARELALLEYLMRHAGKVVSRSAVKQHCASVGGAMPPP